MPLIFIKFHSMLIVITIEAPLGIFTPMDYAWQVILFFIYFFEHAETNGKTAILAALFRLVFMSRDPVLFKRSLL